MGAISEAFEREGMGSVNTEYFGYLEREELVSRIKELRKGDAGHIINLIGHSRGAALSLNVTNNELFKAGISVNLLLALDPVGGRMFTAGGLGFPRKWKNNAAAVMVINAVASKRDFTDTVASLGGDYHRRSKRITSLYWEVDANHGQAWRMLQTPINREHGKIFTGWDALKCESGGCR